MGHFFFADKYELQKTKQFCFLDDSKKTGACYTYPEGKLFAYVNHIIKERENIVNKPFVKTMDELGYDVEI